MTPKQKSFLKSYASTGNIAAAARAAKAGRRTHYDWLGDAEYKQAFDDAKEQAVEFLEAAAWRRATRAKKPSDVLLIFLLKGARPEKYRDNVKIEHSGQLAVSLAERLIAARKRVMPGNDDDNSGSTS